MFNKVTNIKGVAFKGVWTSVAALVGIFIGTLLLVGSMWSPYYYYGGVGGGVKIVFGTMFLLAGIALAFIFAVRNSEAIAKLLFSNIGEVLKHLVCVILAVTVILMPAFGLAFAIKVGAIEVFLVFILSMLGVIIALVFVYAFIQMVLDLSALRKELCIDETENFEDDFEYEAESGCSGSCATCGLDCGSEEALTEEVLTEEILAEEVMEVKSEEE